MSIKSLKNSGPFFFLLIFVFGMYLFTASSSIGWIDSGGIAAAATTLGIPNPPGFPAYLLLAHAFTLIPWGSAVFKLHMVSQLSALGIISGVFWLVRKISPPKKWSFFPSLIAASAIAFSYTLWSQANNIETYTLTNVVALAFFIWIVVHKETYKEHGKKKQKETKTWEYWHLPVLGFLGGVSAGLNPMIVSVGPAIIWWVIKQRTHVFRDLRIFFFTVIMIIVGVVAIYSYLPIRAATHPFVNWGDPVNRERITAHLFGIGLNIYEPETNSINGLTWQPKIFLESFFHYWELAIFQFTPFLFPLVIWGGWKLRKNERTIFEFSALTIVTNMLFVVLYYGGNQESWMLTSWMMMAVFLGYGIFHLPDTWHTPWLLLVGLVPLVFWFPLLNRSHQNFATDYVKNMLRDVPEGSVIIGGGDFFHSLSLFTREVERERRDIIPITGNMFYIFPWYRENLRKNTTIVISPKVEEMIKFKRVDEFTEAVDQLIEDNPNKPFFITPLLLRDSVVAGTKDGNYHTKKYTLIPHGLLLQVVPASTRVVPNEALTEFTFLTPQFMGEKTPFYMERNYKNAYKLLRNDYAVGYSQLAEYFFQQKNVEKALEYFQKAVNQASLDSPEFLHRLAIFYAQIGQIDTAKKYFEDSLARDPGNADMQKNYQTFLSQTTTAKQETSATSSATIPEGSTMFSSPSIGMTFGYPKDWEVTEMKGKITIIPKEKSTFSIVVEKRKRSANISIDDYMKDQKTSYGQLLQQGLAKIPNVDIAYVKVWSQNGISILEFFLFKADIMLHITVGPADSPMMKTFDAIISSISL